VFYYLDMMYGDGSKAPNLERRFNGFDWQIA
jgi:hypothetical protein